MPWKVYQEEGQFCVHMLNADGSKGNKVKCHASQSEANDHMKALYANSNEEFLNEFETISIDQKVSKIRDAFNKTGTNAPVMESTKGIGYIKEIFDGYVIVDVDGQLYKATYSMNDGNVVFQDKADWKKVKTNYVAMMNYFSFTDLMEEIQHLSEIDGMAAGTFTAMNGQKVKFTKKELTEYVANTERVLKSTKDSKGNVIGLPIDLGNHDHQGGAGWIVGIVLDEARGVIRFMVNWTKAGIEAIKGNLSRFFSPSINAENKTILGGSLTNYPATRNGKGEILLRPVELSLSIKELSMSDEQKDLLTVLREGFGSLGDLIRGKKDEASLSHDDGEDKNKKVELTQVEKDALKADYLKELSTTNLQVTELLKSPAIVAELARQADELAKNRLNAEMRKRRAVEFAAEMTGGSENSPYGLAIPAEELVALMLSLPEAQMQAVEKVLRVARLGAIDFAQHGVDGVYPVKPQLPEPIAEMARGWVASGKSIDEFMKVNVELGDPKQYDLSEFRNKDKE